MKFDLLRAAARNEVPVHTASASGDARSQFLGWSPRPTGDPLVHGLVKRETDPLCGYEYADRRSPLTCPEASEECVSDDLLGFVHCCNPDSLGNCIIPTTCMGTIESDNCDDQCMLDPLTNKCFIDDLDCGTRFYDFGSKIYSNFFCGFKAKITIFPTFSNPLEAEEVTTVSMKPLRADSVDSSDTLDPDLSTTELLASDPVPTVSSDDEVGLSAGGIGADGDDSDNDGSDGGTNVGAIVGGVVGGLVVVSIFFSIIAFLILRHRRQKRRDTLATAGTGPHLAEEKLEMPVRDSVASPDQSQQCSVPEPTVNMLMSTNEPIMTSGPPAVSSGFVRYELSSSTAATEKGQEP